MRILGIDPGYDRVGIAVLEKNSLGKEILLFSDCFVTDRAAPLSERIKSIGEVIKKNISEYTPTLLSIEKLYVTKNQKTAMGVAEARGVIIYECTQAGLSSIEVTPMEVKVATTGYGKASKEAVNSFVHKILAVPPKKRHDDEIDAIAIALTGGILFGKK